MAPRIALIGICDKVYVDAILDDIEKRNADKQVHWNPRVDDGVREKLTRQIENDSYFRFFMYEKKSSGGEGIRMAAHVSHWEDVHIKKCYNNEPCFTQFVLKGYEVFDRPMQVSKFRYMDSEKQVESVRGLGKAFEYVLDPEDVKGKDMTVFVMLVWNSNGFQSPTGSMRRFKMGEYYADHGFAHEEWNFRTEHAVDGSVYGFMMGRPKRMHDGAQRPLPVYFYSPFEGDMYLAGAYLRSDLVQDDEIATVQEAHKKRGIIDERTEEVLKVVGDRESFGGLAGFRGKSIQEKRRIVARQLGSEGYSATRYLKCPVEDLVRPQRPIRIDRYLIGMMKEKRGFGKYDIPLYLRVYPVVLNRLGAPDELDESLTADQLARAVVKMARETSEGGTIEPHDASDITYMIKAQSVEFRRKEFDLVDKFRDWLVKKHQIPSLKESDSVDITFAHNGVSYGVEAKYSDGAMRFPIRSALGQLLEYNFYPDRTPKDYWVIVLNRKPTDEDRMWLTRLHLGVPVSLCWQEDEEFVFERSPF